MTEKQGEWFCSISGNIKNASDMCEKNPFRKCRDCANIKFMKFVEDEKMFLESHPSLKGKGICDTPDIDETVEQGYGSEKEVQVYFKKDIAETQIDKQIVERDYTLTSKIPELLDLETTAWKQKVKAAIEKHLPPHQTLLCMGSCPICNFKKELGIE